MDVMKSLIVAATIFAIPMTAAAATVKQRETIRLSDVAYHFNADITPSGDKFDRMVFKFKVLDDLMIDGFDLSMSGNVRADVRKSRYRIVFPRIVGVQKSEKFSISSPIGTASPTGNALQAGDKFKVVFRTRADNPTSFSASFATVPAPVPVPAAGLLLLTALGGIAAIRRRKKAAAA